MNPTNFLYAIKILVAYGEKGKPNRAKGVKHDDAAKPVW